MNDIQCIRCQNDEFKALEYIYLQEFHTLKETNPQKFTIVCQPYTGKQGEYQIKIMFQFTHNYPKAPLKYQIEPITGITRDNMTQITHTIQDIIHGNKDRPIVYDIVQETRVWIQEYLVEGKAYMQDDDDYVKKKEEIFEKPKFSTFTPVTVQSFNAWKKEFDARNKLKKVEKKQTAQGEIKISGKQWFLGKKQEEIEEESDEDDQEYEGEEQQEDDEEQQKKQKIQYDENDVKSNDLFNKL